MRDGNQFAQCRLGVSHQGDKHSDIIDEMMGIKETQKKKCSLLLTPSSTEVVIPI